MNTILQWGPIIVTALMLASAIVKRVVKKETHPLVAEGADLVARMVHEWEDGKTPSEILMEAEKSPEFQDLVQAALKKIRGGAACLLLALLLVFTGCTEKDQLRAVVGEGRALLRHPAPGDPDWEVRRALYLQDSELVAPSTSGS